MEKVKTKVRFTSLDVAAMVQNLQRLLGMRATNIYDLNPSTYIIKLGKSEDKAFLLIQNGVRFHTVDEKTEKKDIPSGFTMKFRKFLRSKRLESVRQVGVERVVVFTFGTEAYTNHLILELYAQGNIILTDADYRILQCIRSHEYNDKVKTAVGEIYPFEHAANIYLENIDVGLPKIEEKLNQNVEKEEEEGQEVQKNKKKKNQKKQGTKLRDIVFKLIPCLFPAVIDNILVQEKLNPDLSVSQQNIQQIQQGAKVCFKFLKDFLKGKHIGYLYSKKQVADKEDKQYFEYSPYKNIKFQQTQAQFKFDSFDTAVAEYYLKYKKSQHQEQEQFEDIAWKKYEQIKKDQQNRVKKLQEEQDIYKVKAEYIQKNLQDVEAIIKIITTMQDNGYSWQAIQRMVLQSKKNDDPLANMIHELNIQKRQVTILLGDASSDDQFFELMPVEINIDYNAYTNATIYYESKKKNYQKQLRTKQASQQVLKIAEKDALKTIQKKKNEKLSKSIPTRKMFWFEKFYWFISSQGILVISGRDSHQNETLVKKYMKAGDLYMHSDYGGAASTIIKISTKQVGIPRATLEQAAIFTVCRSKAWDTKILSGAWWVYHDQVSKSAPTGQFLPAGSFMIRGKRNFIQPNRMEMGITFLFKIDQQSAKRHMNDRKIHQEEIKQQQKQQQTTPQGDSEQYAIISTEVLPKQKGQKGGKNNDKLQNQPQMKKQQSKKASTIQQKQQVVAEKDSDSESDDDSEDAEDKKAKKPQKQNKQQKGKNVQNEQNQPKQRMKNKRKLKKLQKYLQEQDEEERQVIMKMIGAREMKHRVEEDELEQNKNQKNKKDKNKNKKKGLEKYIGSQKQVNSQKINSDKVLFLKKKGDQTSSESEEVQAPKQEQPKAVENQKNKNSEDIPKQEQSQDKKIQNQEETKQKEQQNQNDENDDSPGSDDQKNEQKQQNEEQKKEQKVEQQEIDQKTIDSELAQLFKLVGKAHPQDKIENLVPMCAPYNSLKDNRFKIKLVPGTLKKGKAARNILHFFTNSNQLTEAEKPFVRSLPEQQIINCIIGNAKLAGAGLLKLELKEKAEKKTKKREIQKRENQKKQKNG